MGSGIVSKAIAASCSPIADKNSERDGAQYQIFNPSHLEVICVSSNDSSNDPGSYCIELGILLIKISQKATALGSVCTSSMKIKIPSASDFILCANKIAATIFSIRVISGKKIPVSCYF